MLKGISHPQKKKKEILQYIYYAKGEVYVRGSMSKRTTKLKSIRHQTVGSPESKCWQKRMSVNTAVHGY
jgi:hypothetical protein